MRDPSRDSGIRCIWCKHRGLFWACQRPFQETANPGPESSKQQRPCFQTLA